MLNPQELVALREARRLKNKIDDEALKFIAQENRFRLFYDGRNEKVDRMLDLRTKLILLDLSSPAVGDKVVVALSSSKNVERVETLDLCRRTVNSKGLGAVAASTKFGC